jgi:hypothetical protein
MRIEAICLIVVLAGASALAQQAVPPPPQPAPDKPVAANPPTTSAPAAVQPAANPTAANGPSLEVTLKFIQDKVNDQGKIVYVESISDSLTGERAEENASLGFAHRPSSAKASPSLARGVMKKGYAGAAGPSPEQYADTEVAAVNPAGILSIKETGTKTEAPRSAWVVAAGTEDWTKVWPVNFKNVGKLEVISSTDYKHRMNPAMTYQDDPAYFELVVHMAAGKPATQHILTVPSNRHARSTESDENIQEFALHFRDEDAANRVAKAMIHAIELCGGGSAPELF